MGIRFWDAAVWFGKYKYLLFIAVAPLILCYNWFIYCVGLIGPFTRDNLTYFGDAFGPLNTLFSGFALVGVVIAIILQKKELDATRRELAISADAHAETAKILREEQEEREITAIRAATPVFVSGRKEQIVVTGTKPQIFDWTLKNYSGHIFSPELNIATILDLPYSVSFHYENIVVRDATIIVRVHLGRALEKKEQLPKFEFLLKCVDSTGHKRTQKYSCDPGDNGPIRCVDPDLPAHPPNLFVS